MENFTNKKNLIIKISQEYFDSMAKSYPVMCASDEFYFLPRAKKSAVLLDYLDSLDKQKIENDIYNIQCLKSSLERINCENINLEAQIDSALLNQSMSSFLTEFKELRIWQIDPNIYLKIILFGINQPLIRFSSIKNNIEDGLRVRLSKIPQLLDEGMRNLTKIPSEYLQTALQMTKSSFDYFRTLPSLFENNPGLYKEIGFLTRRILSSLKKFEGFLKKRPIHKSFIKDRDILTSILKNSFSYKKSLQEIFDIANREYNVTLKKLTKIAKEIDSQNSWQQILFAYNIEVKNIKELLALYSKEIRKIKFFLKQTDAITFPKTQTINLRITPQFMKPIRASASYSSPITSRRHEPAYFYITSDFDKISKPSRNRFLNNIHNEYIFVSAHETYPGHHLLDMIRRYHVNPIRQQIESPLFYEGWASYAERLIVELGYIKSPLQSLVGLRRQAWRAVRAMLDVGIRINKLKIVEAEKLLKGLGYNPKIVKLMLRHYVLSPGYQLCYTIGKFEIEILRKRFVSKFGLKKFHDLLLEGGQIPFNLIEKKLKKLCRKSY